MRICNTIWACLAASALCLSLGHASEPPAQKGRRQAILIGIEEYQKAPVLRCSGNDVRQLGMTLRERGDYEVLEIVNSVGDKEAKSESLAIQARVKECLTKLRPEDDVLVYFSCHGFRDKEGRLYLAQVDCDPANPAPGGIPVAWLREQLAACRAKFKLLVLDACHAGSEKGEEPIAEVTAKDLALPLREVAGVVTLASSQADEKSMIWDDKQQSLFTYWLDRGLNGHADENGDGEVTIDELYGYVHDNVKDVASRKFRRNQTPAKIVGPQVPGVPVVIRPAPQTLKGLLDGMAEQLATSIQLQGLSRVGVPEFTTDTQVGELLGGRFGLLGRTCAVELGGRLVVRSAGKFEVVEQDSLEATLHTKGFGVPELRSAAKGLEVQGKAVPALALGTLRDRSGRTITLQCKLVGTDDRRLFATAGGPAVLNESEWSMVGLSVAVPPPPAPTPDNPIPPHRLDPIPMCDELAKKRNPAADPSFPFPIKIMVGGEHRPGEFLGNDYCVPLQKGEVYTIRVETKDDHRVLMRLLVDGRNTLPERVSEKGIVVEPAHAGTWQAAQPVNLSEARAWQLDPSFSRIYEIRGFFSDVGEAGKYREFQVTDAPDSLTARRYYGSSPGLITAAFYTEKGAPSRGVVTEPGAERAEKTRLYKPVDVGNLLATVHIRYLEPEALEKLKRDATRRPPK